jgi:hypothetical protein
LHTRAYRLTHRCPPPRQTHTHTHTHIIFLLLELRQDYVSLFSISELNRYNGQLHTISALRLPVDTKPPVHKIQSRKIKQNTYLCIQRGQYIQTCTHVVLSGVMVNVLATVPKVRRFKPGREKLVF